MASNNINKRYYKYGVSYGIDYLIYFNSAEEIIKFSQHTLIKYITRYNTHKYKNMCLYDWSWYDGVKPSTIIKHYYGSINDYGFNPLDNEDSVIIKYFNNS
jgi:hypothetical protein